MRLPSQAIPVVRGISRSKPTARISILSWGSCVASCVESKLSVTGLGACADLTSASKFETCAEGVLKAVSGLGTVTIVAAVVGCGAGCFF